MITFFTISETRTFLKERQATLQIGFVPTMGALHEGHLELVRRCRRENDIVVASIFVNPIQFNNPSDLEKYPRMPEKDSEMLASAGCDLLFMPPVEEMYPEEVRTAYDFGLLEKVMEGKHRPGHFKGVAIVVKKLFDIVQPGKAYFGLKDYQQLQVIKRLVSIENMPVEIVPCPTVRETDGLAMSSRNLRLSAEHRSAAPLIYKALQGIKERGMEVEIGETLNRAIKQIESTAVLKVEYLELADAESLEPVVQWKPGQRVVACTAVFAGEVRLIDNLVIL